MWLAREPQLNARRKNSIPRSAKSSWVLVRRFQMQTAPARSRLSGVKLSSTTRPPYSIARRPRANAAQLGQAGTGHAAVILRDLHVDEQLTGRAHGRFEVRLLDRHVETVAHDACCGMIDIARHPHRIGDRIAEIGLEAIDGLDRDAEAALCGVLAHPVDLLDSERPLGVPFVLGQLARLPTWA